MPRKERGTAGDYPTEKPGGTLLTAFFILPQKNHQQRAVALRQNAAHIMHVNKKKDQAAAEAPFAMNATKMEASPETMAKPPKT